MAVALLINDPYHHYEAKAKALQTAANLQKPLLAVFVIDPDWLEEIASTVADQGWLGPGMKPRIGQALGEGMHLLATDILAALADEAQAFNVPVSSMICNQPLRELIDQFIREGHAPIIVAKAQDEAMFPATVEVIEDA
jgi:nucleotide-binding universal stress UspA family protein